MGEINKGVIASISVAASGNTTVATIDVPTGGEVMWIEITNANEYDLDAFSLNVKGHSAGSFQTIASTTAAFTTSVAAPLLGSSVDMTTLAKATTGYLRLDVRGVSQVQLTASANTTATHLSGYWSIG